MSTRRFEFRDGKSDKFWMITVDGKATTVNYGRRGTKGQSQTKKWASPAVARKQYETLIAEKRKKGYVETTASGRAKPPVPAPWSPAVSRQLERLEIGCKPFDPPSARRPLDGFGEFGRPGRDPWRGVDPEGQVTEVPPAIWAFSESLDLSPRIFLRTDAGPYDYLRLPLYLGTYDVVVEGARRVLVGFAGATGGNSFLFDLRDRSPDPVVWRAFEETPETYPPAFSIAYPTLSAFLATLAVDGARTDQMPPWAPAVTAQLVRLRAIVVPFDPTARRPLSVGSSFVVRGGPSWKGVDPQGKVTEVPPAVYWFLTNVDFRTADLRLVQPGEDARVLEFGTGSENVDVVVDGKRRLLVMFASDDVQSLYCFDLCDPSPDPAVWSRDHDEYAGYVVFKRLSKFLAALRA